MHSCRHPYKLDATSKTAIVWSASKAHVNSQDGLTRERSNNGLLGIEPGVWSQRADDRQLVFSHSAGGRGRSS